MRKSATVPRGIRTIRRMISKTAPRQPGAEGTHPFSVHRSAWPWRIEVWAALSLRADTPTTTMSCPRKDLATPWRAPGSKARESNTQRIQAETEQGPWFTNKDARLHIQGARVHAHARTSAHVHTHACRCAHIHTRACTRKLTRAEAIVGRTTQGHGAGCFVCTVWRKSADGDRDR